MPVVPATGEAEVGGLLEPGSSRLQRPMIAPRHCSLGDKSLKEQQNLRTEHVRPGAVGGWGMKANIFQSQFSVFYISRNRITFSSKGVFCV